MKIILLLSLSFSLFGQTTVGGGRTSTGVVDNSGASRTLPDRQGTGSPNGRDACSKVGQSYFQSDALAGANTWKCTATGTPGVWTIQGLSATGFSTGTYCISVVSGAVVGIVTCPSSGGGVLFDSSTGLFDSSAGLFDAH